MGRNHYQGGCRPPHAHGKTQKPPKCQVNQPKNLTPTHYPQTTLSLTNPQIRTYKIPTNPPEAKTDETNP